MNNPMPENIQRPKAPPSPPKPYCMFDKMNDGNCCQCYKRGGDKYDCDFPKAGDKLIFKGVPEFYYPMFIKMREDASVLQLGVEYTAKEVRVNSSWVTIYLEEFPETMFNLSFFDQARLEQ